MTAFDTNESSPGDAAMLKNLYKEHSRSLLAYATRLTGDRFAAEDVVQETLLRAWKNPESVQRAGDAVRGWLLTVAKRIIVDRFRAASARPVEVEQSPANQPVDGDHADPVIDGIVVYQALARLSAEHRAVLVEVYYRGRSVVETAKVLGIPEGTARSRTFYALRQLRRIMDDRGCVQQGS